MLHFDARLLLPLHLFEALQALNLECRRTAMNLALAVPLGAPRASGVWASAARNGLIWCRDLIKIETTAQQRGRVSHFRDISHWYKPRPFRRLRNN